MSLVPSVSECLLAWGLTPMAVTRYCEQPGLATVGGTKNPDLDQIRALRPDLVVMDEEENLRRHAELLTEAGLAVHVLAIRSVADVAPQLATLRHRLGLGGPSPGPTAPAPARPPARELRAFVPIWRRPWMTVNGDTYGSSLLGALGVANVFADHPRRYPEVTLEEAARKGPDVVLAPSEPYEFRARHVAELEAVAPVRLVDGKDLFWWGVRTSAALGRLAAELAPLRGDAA